MPSLDTILTAAEAEKMYGLQRGTVRRACREGRVKARKSGMTWLVYKNEIEKVYGDKKK